jgi:hypothetical protein
MCASAGKFTHTNTPTEPYTYIVTAKTLSMTFTESSKEKEMHTKTVYREDVFSCDECIMCQYDNESFTMLTDILQLVLQQMKVHSLLRLFFKLEFNYF